MMCLPIYSVQDSKNQVALEKQVGQDEDLQTKCEDTMMGELGMTCGQFNNLIGNVCDFDAAKLCPCMCENQVALEKQVGQDENLPFCGCDVKKRYNGWKTAEKMCTRRSMPKSKGNEV